MSKEKKQNTEEIENLAEDIKKIKEEIDSEKMISKEKASNETTTNATTTNAKTSKKRKSDKNISEELNNGKEEPIKEGFIKSDKDGARIDEIGPKKEKQFIKMYEMLMDYEESLHEQNQRRIKIGLKCIYIIPLIFLILLFVTDSSRIVFLVLWITSLFGIAIYLISVEYIDYKLQEKMHEIKGNEDGEVDSLISFDQVGERVSTIVEKIEETKEELKL